jgi:hypothetical protein
MGRAWMLMGEPNHTAIVKEVKSPGVYVLLNQNTSQSGKTVSETTIDVSQKVSGDLIIYRPGSAASDTAHANGKKKK